MIIAIVGPTGVGKTKMSISLAKKYNAEIINCDAVQVYQEMNIGTAKIKEEEKEGVPHHLFDICSPKEAYTVFSYQKDCRKKIDEILKIGKNVILVGGTGLYLKATLYDYKFEVEENNNEYDNLTTEEIYQKIIAIEPSPVVDKNNRRRLVRYLNRLENGSKEEKQGNIKLYDAIIIGLTRDRDLLYKSINERVDTMIKEGLIDEAKYLYEKYGKEEKSLQTAIGYKELFNYFEERLTLEQAIYEIQKNSRHYAKRQYTFFNNQLKVEWFSINLSNFDKTISEVETYINSIPKQ